MAEDARRPPTDPTVDPMADPVADDLRALGRVVLVPPPGDDLAGVVLARIESAPVPRTSVLRRAVAGAATLLGRGRRVVVAVLLAVLLAVLVATPASARLAEWLGLGGVVVVQAPGNPAPDPAEQPGVGGDAADLPMETTLAEARTRMAVPLGVPAELGEPDRVLVTADGPVVTMVWATDAGEVRLDQFAGRVEPVFVKRYGGEVEFVTVEGADAFWLSRPHPIEYVDPTGADRRADARTSGPSLVWQRGPVTLRLEGVAALDRARAVAVSVR